MSQELFRLYERSAAALTLIFLALGLYLAQDSNELECPIYYLTGDIAGEDGAVIEAARVSDIEGTKAELVKLLEQVAEDPLKFPGFFFRAYRQPSPGDPQLEELSVMVTNGIDPSKYTITIGSSNPEATGVEKYTGDLNAEGIEHIAKALDAILALESSGMQLTVGTEIRTDEVNNKTLLDRAVPFFYTERAAQLPPSQNLRFRKISISRQLYIYFINGKNVSSNVYHNLVGNFTNPNQQLFSIAIPYEHFTLKKDDQGNSFFVLEPDTHITTLGPVDQKVLRRLANDLQGCK